MTKPKLVAPFFRLQNELKESTKIWGAMALLTDAQIQKARKMRSMIDKGIQKLMTGKPTCNDDRACYSYEGLAPTTQVFYRVFDVQTRDRAKRDGTLKTTFTFGVEDFQSRVLGSYMDGWGLRKDIRYSTLYLTGTRVAVR
ncbi:hypothetical protein BCR34DRAFT_598921 [Clohesyomyces aquaticus]|uniref:Uncharacterized protein n=1 Tax=Clohesyomyces aquaticus TaxID=1231657 RepID=A0A1Y1ZX14_9PLEO|nr:hypothetical protein BCR34DRAFT_598921 [Clohesyomyces aquaticus]